MDEKYLIKIRNKGAVQEQLIIERQLADYFEAQAKWLRENFDEKCKIIAKRDKEIKRMRDLLGMFVDHYNGYTPVICVDDIAEEAQALIENQ